MMCKYVESKVHSIVSIICEHTELVHMKITLYICVLDSGEKGNQSSKGSHFLYPI